MSKSYIIYADESFTHDEELDFNRFYGGCILEASRRQTIDAELCDLVARLGIKGELKWQKVRPNNVDRIKVVVDRFLDMVTEHSLRFRILWLEKRKQQSAALTPYHKSHGYYILYYYFVVLGFGLARHDEDHAVNVIFYPDKLPDNIERKRRFITFLQTAHQAPRYEDGSAFHISEVTDVDSKKHVILQCCDVVLGAVAYRLNDFHLETQKDGTRAAGTIAKDAFSAYILARIEAMHLLDHRIAYSKTASTPLGFGNGAPLFYNNWRHRYRQWNFYRR